MRLLTALFAAMLFPTSAHTATQPPCNDELMALLKIESWGTGLSAKQTNEVMQVMRDVDAFLGPGIKPPRNLQITLEPFGTPFFDSGHEKPILKLLYQYEENVSKGKHPIFTRPIVAHEYGHAILEENLARHSKVFRKYVEEGDKSRAIALSDEITALQDKTSDLHGVPYKEGGDKIDKAAIAEELKQVNAQIESRRLEMDRLMREPRDVLLPYNELFADVVAILYAGDPKATTKAMAFAENKSYSDPHLWLRAFDSKVKAPEVYTTEHEALTLIRRHLWTNYLSKPAIMKRKPEVLEAVLKSIGEEYDRACTHEKAELFSPAWLKSINENLARRLDKNLAPLLPPGSLVHPPEF